MPSNKPRLQTEAAITCCHHCVPPKRHTACWDHCPEYLKEKAEHEAKKAERRKKEEIERRLNAQRYRHVNQPRKGGK